MARWLSVALFVVAVLAFFIVGRQESSQKQAVLASAERSVNEQISRENSGTASPADRAAFLRKQKQVIGSIKKVPSVTAPSEITTTPVVPSQQTTLMPLVITAVFGVAAFWIILSNSHKSDDEGRKWAFATLGTIVGYWLKG